MLRRFTRDLAEASPVRDHVGRQVGMRSDLKPEPPALQEGAEHAIQFLEEEGERHDLRP